jgi:hypothetical protein
VQPDLQIGGWPRNLSLMLRLLDVLLTIVHLAIVVFNLFGWIPKATRKANFITLMLTAASWFLLGIWFETGFCPVTDWQWQVKERLGETNIPPNFIEYIAEKTFKYDFDTAFVSNVIAVSFALAVVASVYVNFVLPRRLRKRAVYPKKQYVENRAEN